MPDFRRFETQRTEGFPHHDRARYPVDHRERQYDVSKCLPRRFAEVALGAPQATLRQMQQMCQKSAKSRLVDVSRLYSAPRRGPSGSAPISVLYHTGSRNRRRPSMTCFHMHPSANWLSGSWQKGICNGVSVPVRNGQAPMPSCFRMDSILQAKISQATIIPGRQSIVSAATWRCETGLPQPDAPFARQSAILPQDGQASWAIICCRFMR